MYVSVIFINFLVRKESNLRIVWILKNVFSWRPWFCIRFYFDIKRLGRFLIRTRSRVTREIKIMTIFRKFDYRSFHLPRFSRIKRIKRKKKLLIGIFNDHICCLVITYYYQLLLNINIIIKYQLLRVLSNIN